MVLNPVATRKIRQRVEMYGSKGQKALLVRWIGKTKDAGVRGQQIWCSIEYFTNLRDFEMVRKLATLEVRLWEQIMAYYLIAVATHELEDIDLLREALFDYEAGVRDAPTLKKIAFLYCGLYGIMAHPVDLARAARISELLLDTSEYACAVEVFFSLIEVHPIAGFYLRAAQAMFNIVDRDYRVGLLQRLYLLLETRLPREDVPLLVAHLLLSPIPEVRAEVEPFITDRLRSLMFCILVKASMHKRFPATA